MCLMSETSLRIAPDVTRGGRHSSPASGPARPLTSANATRALPGRRFVVTAPWYAREAASAGVSSPSGVEHHRHLPCEFMTTSIVEQFALQASGDAHDVRVAGGGARIHRWDNKPYHPPVVVDVSDDDLNRFLDVVADDIDVLWPGRERRWASFALLMTHIDEVLRTREPVPAMLTIDPQGRLIAG